MCGGFKARWCTRLTKASDIPWNQLTRYNQLSSSFSRHMKAENCWDLRKKKRDATTLFYLILHAFKFDHLMSHSMRQFSLTRLTMKSMNAQYFIRFIRKNLLFATKKPTTTRKYGFNLVCEFFNDTKDLWIASLCVIYSTKSPSSVFGFNAR